MTWMMLAVLSAVFLGLYDVAKKASVDGNAVLPVLLVCSSSGLAVMLPLAVISAVAPGMARPHGLLIEAPRV